MTEEKGEVLEKGKVLRWWSPGAPSHGAWGCVAFVDVDNDLFRMKRITPEAWPPFGSELNRAIRYGLDRTHPFEEHGVGWLIPDDWDVQYRAARASRLCYDVDCYCHECGHRHKREVWSLTEKERAK